MSSEVLRRTAKRNEPQGERYPGPHQHREDAIAKEREYLESGEHAHGHGFRPLLAPKVEGGARRCRLSKFGSRTCFSFRQKGLSKTRIGYWEGCPRVCSCTRMTAVST